MFVMGGGYLPGTIPQALGAVAVLLASINVGGGFVLTKRMLDMFKSKLIYQLASSLYPLFVIQGRLTPLNTHGYLPSLVSYSQVVSWQQRAQEWPDWCRLGI